MPRTKMQKKKQGDVPSVQINIKPELLKKNIEKTHRVQLSSLEGYCKRELLNIDPKIANITIGEFMNGLSSTTTASSYIQQILDRTRTTTKQNSRLLTTTAAATTIRRSNSFDEGYLTAGSSNGTSATGGRESRAKRRQLTSRRMSKSTSPKTATKTTTNNKSMMRRYQTPQNRAPPNTYGLITPKVNPNTPQVLLRRPKEGEMVLSLQGSPLYTGSITTDQVANINIPLEDGKLLSLQPRRGLRLSQIPELQPETARQLEMLRDNLNKVCAVSAKR